MVTYGTKPAAMHQLSYDEEESYPIGAKIVRRDFYVDDLIPGGDAVEEVREIRRQVMDLLSQGHFVIRKWCSNESAALEGESECDMEQIPKFYFHIFLFHFSQLPTNQRPIKRVALSTLEAIDFYCSFHYCLDLSIVLAWIRQPPRKFNVFVSNRIAKIQEITENMTWHHVPTNLNPAK